MFCNLPNDLSVIFFLLYSGKGITKYIIFRGVLMFQNLLHHFVRQGSLPLIATLQVFECIVK